MISRLAIATILGLSAAAPTQVDKRQDSATFANDLLTDATCREYYLIVARASDEADNIVSALQMLSPFA